MPSEVCGVRRLCDWPPEKAARKQDAGGLQQSGCHQDIAGHVSKQMLKHYSHIRMEAKQTALESIVKKQTDAEPSSERNELAEESMQKS
jgi:hypothetical protein